MGVRKKNPNLSVTFCSLALQKDSSNYQLDGGIPEEAQMSFSDACTGRTECWLSIYSTPCFSGLSRCIVLVRLKGQKSDMIFHYPQGKELALNVAITDGCTQAKGQSEGQGGNIHL